MVSEMGCRAVPLPMIKLRLPVIQFNGEQSAQPWPQDTTNHVSYSNVLDSGGSHSVYSTQYGHQYIYNIS